MPGRPAILEVVAVPEARWNDGEVLAWTGQDGPGRPPAGPSRWITGSVAATLAVTVGGILATDTLCPEHRAWVHGLGAIAIVSAVVSIALVLRGQASAGLFALFSSVMGIGIGGIDAVHAPGRGGLIVLGFALAAAGSAVVAFRIASFAAWDRTVATAHRADPEVAGPQVDGPQVVEVPATEPAGRSPRA